METPQSVHVFQLKPHRLYQFMTQAFGKSIEQHSCTMQFYLGEKDNIFCLLIFHGIKWIRDYNTNTITKKISEKKQTTPKALALIQPYYMWVSKANKGGTMLWISMVTITVQNINNVGWYVSALLANIMGYLMKLQSTGYFLWLLTELNKLAEVLAKHASLKWWHMGIFSPKIMFKNHIYRDSWVLTIYIFLQQE